MRRRHWDSLRGFVHGVHVGVSAGSVWRCVCEGECWGGSCIAMCVEGAASSYASSEYGSCRVCVEGRCTEVFRWEV